MPTQCEETISGTSNSIFSKDTTNKYIIKLKQLESKFNTSNTNRSKLVNLKNMLKLNEDVNSIIDQNKKEYENKEKENNNISHSLKDMSNTIDNYKKNKMDKNAKITIAEQKNKDIDIYYIVYILFILLLIIIQSSVVLFK